MGHFVAHSDTMDHGGFRAIFWDVAKDLRMAIEDHVVMLSQLSVRHTPSNGATNHLNVLCNRNAVHDMLLQHGFHTEWQGGIRISSVSSAAGATARIILAVVVQTGGGFLSGNRKDATLEDREDCYGRATIALTRAIHLTYILSPLDMAGWPGMAQVLAVYHIGFVKLQDRTISDHMKPSVPSDAAAVLEWSLQSPFRATDGPPLALTTLVGSENEKRYRRYRRYRLSQSCFYPCPNAADYVYGYAADEYRSPYYGSVWRLMAKISSCTATEGPASTMQKQHKTTAAYSICFQVFDEKESIDLMGASLLLPHGCILWLLR